MSEATRLTSPHGRVARNCGSRWKVIHRSLLPTPSSRCIHRYWTRMIWMCPITRQSMTQSCARTWSSLPSVQLSIASKTIYLLRHFTKMAAAVLSSHLSTSSSTLHSRAIQTGDCRLTKKITELTAVRATASSRAQSGGNCSQTTRRLTCNTAIWERCQRTAVTGCGRRRSRR